MEYGLNRVDKATRHVSILEVHSLKGAKIFSDQNLLTKELERKGNVKS